MAIIVHDMWTQIGTTDNGTPIKAVGVYDGDRMVGRVVDLCNGNYRADYLNMEGEVEGIIMPDYFTAVARVADEVEQRRKRMN